MSSERQGARRGRPFHSQHLTWMVFPDRTRDAVDGRAVEGINPTRNNRQVQTRSAQSNNFVRPKDAGVGPDGGVRMSSDLDGLGKIESG